MSVEAAGPRKSSRGALIILAAGHRHRSPMATRMSSIRRKRTRMSAASCAGGRRHSPPIRHSQRKTVGFSPRRAASRVAFFLNTLALAIGICFDVLNDSARSGWLHRSCCRLRHRFPSATCRIPREHAAPRRAARAGDRPRRRRLRVRSAARHDRRTFAAGVGLDSRRVKPRRDGASHCPQDSPAPSTLGGPFAAAAGGLRSSLQIPADRPPPLTPTATNRSFE